MIIPQATLMLPDDTQGCSFCKNRFADRAVIFKICVANIYIYMLDIYIYISLAEKCMCNRKTMKKHQSGV